MKLVLHGYWRSSASYRVRIALNLKGLAYDQSTYDLRTGSQRGAEFRALSPIGLVPALEADDQVLTQSPAILEWLEECFPEPALLPADSSARATVRAMANIVACDIHPLNNLRVLGELRSTFGADAAAVQAWMARWMTDGFAAMETAVQKYGDGFCFGGNPTIADCCLIPQIYNARRFSVDLAPFPGLVAVDARCRTIDAFLQALPEAQPDADKAAG